MSAPRRTAALFDMDRTLVRRETASLYMRYMREQGGATAWESARVAYWVLRYTLGVLDAQQVAKKLIGELRGMPETVMSARCDDWVRRDVARHIADRGREAVRRHKQRGDVVAIVTGASLYTARPVARLLGIDHVVCSPFEIEDHLFTGRHEEPLCYGEGKVTRAEALGAREGFRLDEATFYTDSYTDLPLLLRVREPVIVNPDPRLLREAKKRAWRVERW